jgi:23S rRNA pseudouridine955/2504/2580 synthase
MKRFTVTGEWHGARLDRFVREAFPGIPFGVMQILLRKGLIYLNGDKAAGNVRLAAGDVVAINVAEAEENGAPPSGGSKKDRAKRGIEKQRRTSSTRIGRLASLAGHGSIGKEIAILYEDDDLLVLDKPAGLVVQPGNRKERGSLLDLLEDYRRRSLERHANSPSTRALPPPERAPDGESPFRYAPVHRLDRDTSGALIVAKTRSAARALSRSLARGLVLKTYIAIVEGVPSERTGEISTALATRKRRISHSSPDASGKQARTRYTVLEVMPGNRAILEVAIRSGRTHQIRAHLASIGHPLAGDREYGASANRAGTFLLHAWRIEFPHPASGATVVVEAPPPMKAKLQQRRNHG